MRGFPAIEEAQGSASRRGDDESGYPFLRGIVQDGIRF